MGHTTTANRPSTPSMPVGADVEGERFQSAARLVIAPNAGVFEPAGELRSGSAVSAGQIVGHLTSGTERTPVVSPFSGRAGATLAWAGERVTPHQPVMWLSMGTGAP